MTTLQELGTAVIQIREALEDMNLKGSHNAAILLFCNKKCNEIVASINEAAKTAKPGDIEVHLDVAEEGTIQKEDDLNGDHSGASSGD